MTPAGGMRWPKWILAVLLGLSLPAVLFAAIAVAQPPGSQTAASSSAAARANASASASAQPADAGASALVDAEGAVNDAHTQALREKAARVRALTRGELEAGIDPSSLFDIHLDDEPAIALEILRLTKLIEAIDTSEREMPNEEDAGPPEDAGPVQSAASARHAGKDAEAPLDAGADQEPDAATEASEPVVDPIEQARFDARIDLDRARLGFYILPLEERERILSEHQIKSAPPEPEIKTEIAIDEAERRSDEAEAAQRMALEDAAKARTEATRLVGEEYARLLGVAKDQADLEAALGRERIAASSRTEAVLAWKRRVRTAIDKRAQAGSSEAADRTYDELRVDLGAGRDAFAAALRALIAPTRVPEPGDDRLASLPPEVDASRARAKRAELLAEADRLRELERVDRSANARALYSEVVALNGERLRLYELLSSSKRSAITGFGAAGRDQAAAELRQISLVAWYLWAASGRWSAAFGVANSSHSLSALAIGWLLLKCLVPILIFVAWRRRAKPLLARALEASTATRRATGSILASPAERWLAIIARARGPLEWLLLAVAVVALLPAAARDLLETRVVATVLTWSLAGSCAVLALDAIAGDSAGRARASRMITAHIRLRSLKLIGRVVVVVAVLLSLASTLVGKGTIYSWVFSTCWFAAIPIALLLVRWWREVIFERIHLRRRKNAFDHWALERKKGWQSVLVALAAGIYLLAVGTWRAAQAWVGSFDLSRRILAYMFRRGMTKRAEGKAEEPLRPLDDAIVERLGPEKRAVELVASVADDEITRVLALIRAKGGGVYAVVGERGAGKSTMLDRIQREMGHAVRVDCEGSDTDRFAATLARAMGGSGDASLTEVATALDDPSRDTGLLIDDAHRLILPMMGGLSSFDTILETARKSSRNLTWVFAFDSVIWRLFERARGARPLFDDVVVLEPWREEGIARLLMSRNVEAGVRPSFHRLLDQLPADADEIDRKEALDRIAGGYFRLIWDYARGNAGVALHTWRSCLGAGDGDQIEVRVFHAPDAVGLESLPDPAVFVLRAVLQLDLATPADICKATMLSASQVADTLRYGTARGYFIVVGERYRIAWDWFRPITGFLSRRHLLSLA